MTWDFPEEYYVRTDNHPETVVIASSYEEAAEIFGKQRYDLYNQDISRVPLIITNKGLEKTFVLKSKTIKTFSAKMVIDEQ